MSWAARARVPRVLGPRRRLREAMDACALLEAGHAEAKEEGRPHHCGPRENEPGHGTGPAAPGTGWSTARRRLRDMVHRARLYAKALRTESGLTQGQLAAREGVSGRRINQVLSILRLEESILDVVHHGFLDNLGGPFRPRPEQGLRNPPVPLRA